MIQTDINQILTYMNEIWTSYEHSPQKKNHFGSLNAFISVCICMYILHRFQRFKQIRSYTYLAHICSYWRYQLPTASTLRRWPLGWAPNPYTRICTCIDRYGQTWTCLGNMYHMRWKYAQQRWPSGYGGCMALEGPWIDSGWGHGNFLFLRSGQARLFWERI